jgi:hypothetical protein
MIAYAGRKTLRLHCAHLSGVYHGRPPLVDDGGLGLGDPLKLALAALCPGRPGRLGSDFFFVVRSAA